jgi:hypothetical protein
MRIAVLGAGSTALANAWFLARAGQMPITEAPIRLASGLYARDCTGKGHTVERLELAALSSRDIRAIPVNGF